MSDIVAKDNIDAYELAVMPRRVAMAARLVRLVAWLIDIRAHTQYKTFVPGWSN